MLPLHWFTKLQFFECSECFWKVLNPLWFGWWVRLHSPPSLVAQEHLTNTLQGLEISKIRLKMVVTNHAHGKLQNLVRQKRKLEKATSYTVRKSVEDGHPTCFISRKTLSFCPHAWICWVYFLKKEQFQGEIPKENRLVFWFRTLFNTTNSSVQFVLSSFEPHSANGIILRRIFGGFGGPIEMRLSQAVKSSHKA